MAKALFHKAQRVFVKPVGTYALVEKVIPHWVKGMDEPLRVTYDVGLGRDFSAGELISEDTMRGHSDDPDELLLDQWCIQRQNNRWQGDGDSSHHPYPGTFPVVLTDECNWGGWRVPGAEYNRDPARIEHQARMIANAPDLVRLCKTLVEAAERSTDEPTEEVKMALAKAHTILRHIYDVTDYTAQAAE